MGQIKNIKLHIVTDIKHLTDAIVSNMEPSKLQAVTWTSNMKSDLLILYEETMDERYDPDGCTVNVKSSLHLKWEDAGYGHYGLTPLDLLDQSFKIKYHDLVTNFDKEFPQKIEGLRRVFEELDRENAVPVSDVAHFLKELDAKLLQKKTSTKEIERDIRQTLDLGQGDKELNMIQTVELLSDLMPVDTEQELIQAFQIFDVHNTGYITMAEFDNIMIMHGYPLSENDLKTLKKSSVIFERKELDQKQGPEIDYRAFVKHFLKEINIQEESIRGLK